MPKKKKNKLTEFKLSKHKKRVHLGDSDELLSPSPPKKEKITYPKKEKISAKKISTKNMQKEKIDIDKDINTYTNKLEEDKIKGLDNEIIQFFLDKYKEFNFDDEIFYNKDSDGNIIKFKDINESDKTNSEDLDELNNEIQLNNNEIKK